MTSRRVIRPPRVPEQMIDVDGVALCVETFGEVGDPAVLLIHGLQASMLWWDESFCRVLADAGRFVVRYDHRDTGRSAADEPGRPGYTGADLTTDAVGVLDALGIGAAHVVGVSAGGGIAQELGLGWPDRVRSLVLISTTPVAGDRGELPPPAESFGRFVASAAVEWSHLDSVVEYLVGFVGMLAGDQRSFDEGACRALICRDLERARVPAALQNHDLLDHGDPVPGKLSSVDAPTLVVHGTADPMFPPAHGEALAAAIPGARLLLLDGAGHGIDPADQATIVAAVVDHTEGRP